MSAGLNSIDAEAQAIAKKDCQIDEKEVRDESAEHRAN